ncbi:amidohydrolase [Streptomyces sp. NBC_01386]|uniref:amidohydrolase n=1 Tax=Streptomyces sp. NBC_01386 TaxID=2903848 RepID=UPI0032538811
MTDILWTGLDQLTENLEVLYRDLHQHPELPLQEHRTAERVAQTLGMLGYDVTEHVGGTGVVGILRSGEGPVVMLRSELDALPVQEKTGLPYASTARAIGPDGRDTAVMHACGHDMHITCLIGAATLLAQATDAWSGTVMLVFQPAEELARGARDMVDDGLFDRFPTPDIVLGQHIVPYPAGTIAYGSGTVMAAMDAASVVLHGRGGHGSSPENTIDPVLMAAHVITRLQGIVAREVAASERAVVTVGRLQAGTKDNIIPDTAELGVNVRSFSAATRSTVRQAIERIVQGEADASGAPKPPEVEWTIEAPATENDPEATATTVAALAAHFGDGCVTEVPPVSASEDVGVFGTACGAPTVFWFLGCLDPADCAAAAQGTGLKSQLTNHSPHFAPLIRPTLPAGIQALVTAAMTWLGSRSS